MDDKVSILIVDDRPEKLLSLEAVLEDLNQNLVRAYSGKEALRHILHQEFAVILLDVNMPGMDGFETAALIRQRKSSEHIPIIFVTAFGDEMHMCRGYSLGAVDYILTPVIPEVLRTKVSVFVDVFKKTLQVKRQAESLRQRAAQLHKLTDASLAINSAASMESMLRVVTQTAREMIGAHQSFTITCFNRKWSTAACLASFSEKYAAWRNLELKPVESDIYTQVCSRNKPMRLTQPELEMHPAWEEAGGVPGMPPMLGWLAAPLTGRDGRGLGLIHLSDKHEGEFTEDDQAILVQLAQMTSIAIENSLFAEEREVNRIKDEFLSTLSHELRTPLNAILGWTQLLRMEEPTGDLAHGLEVIERNVKSQTKLIEDLLDVSRISTGKLRLNLRPMALSPVIMAAIDSMRPAADAKSIVMDCVLPTGGDQIHGDPDRLQQVVWNLLANAVKFTPAGGRIHAGLERLGANLQICVSDTGKGIDPQFLPHVFDRFKQADSTSTRSHEGLGIGLTIVRHIVELHGGTVQAESNGENQGAAFKVNLSAAVEAAENGHSIHPSSAEMSSRLASDSMADISGLHVLIVDDEPDAREVLAQILKKAQAKVSTAASASEAMDMLRQLRPDVLVSDIAMPLQDGYALIRGVRQLPAEEGGNIPAVALTAYAREEDRRRSLAAGFQMHLAKPVGSKDLILTVGNLAASRDRLETRPVLASG